MTITESDIRAIVETVIDKIGGTDTVDWSAVLDNYEKLTGISPIEVIMDKAKKKECKKWVVANNIALGGTFDVKIHRLRDIECNKSAAIIMDTASKLLQEFQCGDDRIFDYRTRHDRPFIQRINAVAKEIAPQVAIVSKRGYTEILGKLSKNGNNVLNGSICWLLSYFILKARVKNENNDGIDYENSISQYNVYDDDDLDSALDRFDSESPAKAGKAKERVKEICERYLLYVVATDKGSGITSPDDPASKHVDWLVRFVNSNDIDILVNKIMPYVNRIQGHSSVNNGTSYNKTDSLLYYLPSVLALYAVAAQTQYQLQDRFFALLGEDVFRPLRASLYLRRKKNAGSDGNELNVIRTLGLNQYDAMDPLNEVDDDTIENMALTLVKKEPSFKNALSTGDNFNLAVAERICHYISDRVALATNLKISKKYGNLLTFENLCNKNFTAEAALKQLGDQFYAKNEGKMVIYKEDGTWDELSFFDFVKNEEADKGAKTQNDIFEYIRSNFKNGHWYQEYNRGEKDDADLGRLSIDILETIFHICVEYQGECHFKPNNVQAVDYDTKYTELRDKILEAFRIAQESAFGISMVRIKNNFKKTIISILMQYVREHDDEQLSALREFLTSVNGDVNKCFSDGSIFRKSVNIVSPDRWLNEINCYVHKQNDKRKSQIIKNKNWDLIYVIPGGTTISEQQINNFKNEYKGFPIIRWNAKERGSLISTIGALMKKKPQAATVSEINFGKIARSAINEAMVEDNRGTKIISQWIMKFRDPVSNINSPIGSYNPSYHFNGLQFYFNPPFNENGESTPEVSGMLAVDGSGVIWISDYDGEWYRLVDCPNGTIEKISAVLMKYNG